VPEPTPQRNLDVYFAGAGLSCAAGLPNTPALIDEVLRLAEHKVWLVTERLPERLDEAFAFFYPDASNDGFRPSVVDFFSALRTFLDVGAGLKGTGFNDAPELYRSLKLAIAHLLVERLRDLKEEDLQSHDYLDRITTPGNVVITSNWDVLLERTAQVKGVPVRLAGRPDDSSLLVLKLHGSIDWCTAYNAKRSITTDDYSMLSERLFPARPYTVRISAAALKATEDDEGPVIRTRSLEHWNDAWRRLRSRISDPHMVTMVRGKSGDLGPLHEVWRDAYAAVSRARLLEIVGYSMPPDDTEIRTLLRAGIGRGRRRPKVVVRNPSPDVHDRVRGFLDRSSTSSYLPVDHV
jgi:hypothetical protein